ncbi:DER1-like protein,putative [Plasmodium sp. DRC-Itaito]|nr:DER1-like protein,putative [Plasmodium sp. DRC-Itaito]
MDISGPEVWYNNLPNVTKYVITLIFLVTLLITCNLLNVVYILLDWNLIYYKYHIWRIFLNFLYVGKFSLSWVFFMSLFAQFSSSLEKNAIFTSPGSYLYFITIQCTFLSLISILFYWPRGYPFLGNSLLFAIIYYWSRREAWSHVSIYFFTVKGYQLPFALIFLHLIMGQSLWVDIMGLLSGHVYYFFREILPREGGPNLLDKTPKIFDKIMLKLQEFRLNNGIRNNFQRYGYTNINNPRGTNNNNGTNRRVFIGRGVRLGDS